MGIAVKKEQIVDDKEIDKNSENRYERIKKDYHNATFDGQIISYYVLEEKFDLLQDRMLDNLHYLDEKIIIFKTDLNHTIDGVEVRLNEKIEKLDAKIDSVEVRLNAKIDSVEVRLNAKIDSVEVRLNEKIEKLDSRIERLDAKIDSVEVRLDEKIDGVEVRLNEKIEKLDEKMEFVKNDLMQINSKLTLFESKLGFKGQLISSLTIISTLAVSYFVVQLFVALGKYLGI